MMSDDLSGPLGRTMATKVPGLCAVRALLAGSLMMIPFAQAESLASFPDSLEEWVLVKESMIPGKDVVVPDSVSLFLQDTIRTYNWINNGDGTRLNIYVPKEKLDAYRTHGPYEDGPTAVGIYEESDIIFVTEHLMGEPIYGVYDRQGRDISHTHPTLSVEACVRCHYDNADICRNGTCATPIIDAF